MVEKVNRALEPNKNVPKRIISTALVPFCLLFLCNLLAVSLTALQVTGEVRTDSFYFLPGARNTKSIQQVCLVLFWFLGMKHNHCFPDLCLEVGLKTYFSQKI